ncbi:tubulin polymerization-promoting protein family member 2 [Lingula anatina]|uniref:Tubulin polymerization-promoting protein family member 2 n=1 Tax=Lingula anatina TaxID=7574 RepID=A0A1S3IXV6_LINAN|nr:tubulin polymerization-promoting protein family member 2 [Lingula anatina]|eukprot:XP_013402863.1 tubulin polymerization-promoting protein family member 2 [Lingula anatina]
MAQRRYTVFLILLMLDPRCYIHSAEMAESGLEAKFLEYCKSAGRETTAKKATINKMFTDCELFNDKFGSIDLDVAFHMAKANGSSVINFTEFEVLLRHQKLTNAHDFDVRVKIAECDGPIDTARQPGAYISENTGSHKERFDESGNGGGREDAVENSGYVGRYQGAGRYNPKH